MAALDLQWCANLARNRDRSLPLLRTLLPCRVDSLAPHRQPRILWRSNMSVRASSPNARLLVVEDDPDISMLLAHSLGRAGFAVETLSSGAEVLAEARRRTPDLDPAGPDAARPRRPGSLPRAARRSGHRGDPDHHAHRPRRGVRPHRRARAGRRRLHHQAVQPERSRRARPRAAAPRAAARLREACCATARWWSTSSGTR